MQKSFQIIGDLKGLNLRFFCYAREIVIWIQKDALVISFLRIGTQAVGFYRNTLR